MKIEDLRSMRFLKLVPVLVVTTSISLSAFAYDGYRHQRMPIRHLPDNTPLPDVEILPNDDISAKAAFHKALGCLRRDDQNQATEYFERSIAALRKCPGFYDKHLAKQIVLKYGALLETHLATAKSIALKKEFSDKISLSRSSQCQ